MYIYISIYIYIYIHIYIYIYVYIYVYVYTCVYTYVCVCDFLYPPPVFSQVHLGVEIGGKAALSRREELDQWRRQRDAKKEADRLEREGGKVYICIYIYICMCISRCVYLDVYMYTCMAISCNIYRSSISGGGSAMRKRKRTGSNGRVERYIFVYIYVYVCVYLDVYMYTCMAISC